MGSSKFKIEDHPISNVKWVDIDTLHGNDYNPNFVATNEMKLLKLSLMEDGWTQPIVARRNGEIVDGFHRWSIAKKTKEICEPTDNKVPVVFLSKDIPTDQQIMSTIRHNRARGLHGVLKMADVIKRLVDDENCSEEDIRHRLGMEKEEVDRLYDRSGMTERGSIGEFRKGWAPIPGSGNIRSDVDPTDGVTSKAASSKGGGKKKAQSFAGDR